MPSDMVVRQTTASGSTAATPAAGKAATGEAATAPEAASAHPNPTLRLDPALGLVVIEFRNEAGEVTRTIPSARQLKAYRHTLGETGGTHRASSEEA